MKPRNKREAKFLEISNRFTQSKSILSQNKKGEDVYTYCQGDEYRTLKDWSYNNVMRKLLLFSHKKMHYCGECNHSWKGNQSHTRILKKDTCPSCGEELEVCDRNSETIINENQYFYKLDIFEGYQVVRAFMVTKYTRRKQEPVFWMTEVVRHFVEPGKKLMTFSLKGGMGGGYYKPNWVFSSDLEPRSNTYGFQNRTNISLTNLYPKISVKTIFRKRGYSKSFYGYTPHSFFDMIMNDSKFETLLKLRKRNILNSSHRNINDVKNEYWKTFLICFRNNYKIKDVGLYLDYLRYLEIYNRDLHSPKFIMPKNLKKEHDRYMKKREEHLRKERVLFDAEVLRKKIEKEKEDSINYQKRIKPFSDLVISNGTISITPLLSVREFDIEGTALKHCVFSKTYFNDKNALILSAKVNGKRTETVELDLVKMSIEQSRGLNNVSSEYHSEIKDLLLNNINLIEKRCQMK